MPHVSCPPLPTSHFLLPTPISRLSPFVRVVGFELTGLSLWVGSQLVPLVGFAPFTRYVLTHYCTHTTTVLTPLLYSHHYCTPTLVGFAPFTSVFILLFVGEATRSTLTPSPL
jgi:hypothetical protein